MLNPLEILGISADLEVAASESPQVDQRPAKLVETVQPLLELQSGGIFAIEKFPDAMVVGREVVIVSFEIGDFAT